MRESYLSMYVLWSNIKYYEFKWKFCGDFKIVAILLVMQGDRQTCQEKEMVKKDRFCFRKFNITNTRLVEQNKILLTLFHDARLEIIK